MSFCLTVPSGYEGHKAISHSNKEGSLLEPAISKTVDPLQLLSYLHVVHLSTFHGLSFPQSLLPECAPQPGPTGLSNYPLKDTRSELRQPIILLTSLPYRAYHLCQVRMISNSNSDPTR